MKYLLVVAFVALAVSASAMSPEEKEALSANNLHRIEILDPKPKQAMIDFLKDLSLHETFIRLSMAIKGGHSVFYDFVEGKSEEVKAAAEAHSLSIVPSRSPCKTKDGECGRIVLPGGDVVEANVVPDNRQERAGMPKEGVPGGETAAEAAEEKKEEPEEKKVEEVEKGEKETTASGANHGPLEQQEEDKNATKAGPLSADQRQWYFDNNYAQVTKMDAKAQKYVKKFLNDMKENAPETVLHFMSPVRNGHVIRFTVVQGDESSIQKYATTCGMTLDGDTLTTPGGDVVEAEDTLETDGAEHEVAEELEENKAGVPEKIKTGTLKRGALHDKWIHPETKGAFLEQSDDADALIQAHSDDADALLQEPQHDDADALTRQ